MENAVASKLHQLVTSRNVASLGTLHSGAPYVSMVPFALLPDGSAFVIHVSALAAHTNDMLADPRVSLLVTEEEQEGASPQSLPRVTIQGTAQQVPDDAAPYELARSAYLTRFPDASPMFELGDFSLFAISPSSVRLVAGFGRALTLTPESFAQAVRRTG